MCTSRWRCAGVGAALAIYKRRVAGAVAARAIEVFAGDVAVRAMQIAGGRRLARARASTPSKDARREITSRAARDHVARRARSRRAPREITSRAARGHVARDLVVMDGS